jgi:hypothetical protein
VTSTTAGSLYDMTESGNVAAIPEGTYNVKVEAARPNEKNYEGRTIFLDLLILDGPSAGKVAQITLRVPDPEKDKRGAAFHWRNKIAGFFAYDSVKEAIRKFEDLELDNALNTLSDALVEKTVSATLGIQQAGPYKGSNELTATSPPSSVTPAPQAAAAVEAPAPTPVAAPEEQVQPKAKMPF